MLTAATSRCGGPAQALQTLGEKPPGPSHLGGSGGKDNSGIQKKMKKENHAFLIALDPRFRHILEQIKFPPSSCTSSPPRVVKQGLTWAFQGAGFGTPLSANFEVFSSVQDQVRGEPKHKIEGAVVIL